MGKLNLTCPVIESAYLTNFVGLMVLHPITQKNLVFRQCYSSDPIVIGKLHAKHVVDFRIPLETIMRFKPEMFEDIKLIDDELTKINETWCEVVRATKIHPIHVPEKHATKKLSECHSDIRQRNDRQYTYLAERMELFRQKRLTIFDLHSQFKMILDNLSRKDRMMKRDASNFFKAVFGIPSSNDYKNLVNNLNLLKNSHNTLVNDTRKLAGSLNLTHIVLKKHQGELDKLRMSLVGFQTQLFCY